MAVTAGFRDEVERDRSAPDVASRLAAGATLLLAALPVAMALANRSAPFWLALAAILAIASAMRRAGWQSLGKALASPARSPLGLVAAAFIVLAAVSYGWSADPAETRRALSEAAVPLIAGLAILLLWPRSAPRWAAIGLAAGTTLAALICILELKLGMPLRHWLHLRAMAFEYNRPVLTLLVLFWPLCAAALARRNVTIWLALAVTTAAVWSSQSGTAMLAQAVSAAVVLLTSRFPRVALVCVGVAVTVVFASIFAFGDIAWRLLPDSFLKVLAWTHAADRVEIWRSFGAAMLVHPWLGAGFGTSATLGDTTIPAAVPVELQRMLPVGHPHNGYLQIGVELGLVGCTLALAMLLMLLWSWRDLRGRELWPRLGLFTMVAATMLVGHGAWQAWWIAVLYAGGAALRVFARDPDSRLEAARR
jgi:O-antigen ligase